MNEQVERTFCFDEMETDFCCEKHYQCIFCEDYHCDLCGQTQQSATTVDDEWVCELCVLHLSKEDEIEDNIVMFAKELRPDQMA